MKFYSSIVVLIMSLFLLTACEDNQAETKTEVVKETKTVVVEKPTSTPAPVDDRNDVERAADEVGDAADEIKDAAESVKGAREALEDVPR